MKAVIKIINISVCVNMGSPLSAWMSPGLFPSFLPLPVSPGFVFFPLSLPAITLSLFFFVFGSCMFSSCRIKIHNWKQSWKGVITYSCETCLCSCNWAVLPHLLQQSDYDDVFYLFSSPPFCGEICLFLLLAEEAWLLVIHLPLPCKNLMKTLRQDSANNSDFHFILNQHILFK